MGQWFNGFATSGYVSNLKWALESEDLFVYLDPTPNLVPGLEPSLESKFGIWGSEFEFWPLWAPLLWMLCAGKSKPYTRYKRIEKDHNSSQITTMLSNNSHATDLLYVWPLWPEMKGSSQIVNLKGPHLHDPTGRGATEGNISDWQMLWWKSVMDYAVMDKRMMCINNNTHPTRRKKKQPDVCLYRSSHRTMWLHVEFDWWKKNLYSDAPTHMTSSREPVMSVLGSSACVGVCFVFIEICRWHLPFWKSILDR